ncbi:MAG: alpha-D-glucose phosphate-specific phosphoglucomutase [Verrucomicrobiales bacterium]|nr:alpha-D-glucose phosphate-specific phosphoglucomutase [Verrucomicrobiales bacterium]
MNPANSAKPVDRASELAGKRAPKELLIDLDRLEREYFEGRPDYANPAERVSFGTSGHRGTPFKRTFTEAHILAITQAICEYRAKAGITGPLFLGRDTHHVSFAAKQTALEVLAANGVETVIQEGESATPTPAISRAILRHNADPGAGRADGIVITPSHNPPEDGGFKYNPPHGGPAESGVTRVIQDRANELLADANREVRRWAFERARAAGTTHHRDLLMPYVQELAEVIDFEVIRGAGLKLGVDPLGGASLRYWDPIADHYRLDLHVVHPVVDGRFEFMTVDHDGKIRMDCSSPWAMAGLVALKDHYDVAFGNDPDADRHGIVTRSAGLLNPNAYLAVAIEYLLQHRPHWSPKVKVGKTVVSSVMIDRVVLAAGRELYEVPVGFKWFAPGLFDGSVCFGGEESAGASFVKQDGTVWTTDKDGLLLGLLAAEIMARTGKDPAELYRNLEHRFGPVFYTRLDNDLGAEGKQALASLSPDAVAQTELAGDPITARMTRAPGNDEPIGGLKVVTQAGWFAARPSGTEDKYKIYAESERGGDHLRAMTAEAGALVDRVLPSA